MGDVWANSLMNFFANSLWMYWVRCSYRDGEEFLTGSILKTVRMYTTHAVQGEQDFTG